MANSFLIVYELIPEKLMIFYVPAEKVTPEIENLKKIHGTVMNSDDLTEEQEKIHEWISCASCENPEYANNDGKPGELCKFLISDRTDSNAITLVLNGHLTLVNIAFAL